MKLCVTALNNTIDSPIDSRFGRCSHFIIVDADSLDYEAFPNPNIDSSGGAGIQSGQFISSQKVDAVLTGHVGVNAIQTLSAAGVTVFTEISGTVRQAIEDYKAGKLRKTDSSTVKSKSGSGHKRQ